MTPIEEASKHVTAIYKALNSREDSEYNPIFPNTALRLLGNREEELRYSVLFGGDPQKLEEIGQKLVPIFESAWTRQRKSSPVMDVRDNPDYLRTISDGCRGLIGLGNYGHFRDPDFKLVVVLNKLTMYLDERERLVTQTLALRLM